jgi:hypothetical protein
MKTSVIHASKKGLLVFSFVELSSLSINVLSSAIDTLLDFARTHCPIGSRPNKELKDQLG